MKRNVFFIGVATAALTLSCGTKEKMTIQNSKANSGIRVETITVTKQESKQKLNYSGLIEPTVNAQLSFQIPGTVKRIYVDEGDFVAMGQALAELDKTTYQSSYNAAKATQVQARDAYDRLLKVYEKGSLPDIKWEEVKSKLQQANSAEQIARNNLNKCTLKAPASGIIGSKDVEAGNSALPGVPVIDFVKINDVFVRISVPENEINKFQKGQLASVVVPAISQHMYQGKVERIGVVANQISKTYEVKIRLNNNDLEIKPGMVCDVNLVLEKDKSTIEIPSQSVVKGKDNKNYVFLIDSKSAMAVKREVEVGEFANNNLQILSGINYGDMLVITGQHKLNNNMKVVL